MRRLALYADWRDSDDTGPSAEDVSSFLVGHVTGARYSFGQDYIELTYADGRTVRVCLHQCKAHTCDETMMILEDVTP